MILDPKLVAQGWLDLRLQKLGTRERTLGSWADDLIMEATHNDAEYALQIIFAIHELDPDHEAADVFAAGPLEDLLAYQGAYVIDEIERRATNDSSFAFVLGGVWKNIIPDPIWNRILACRDRRGWDGIPH